MRQSTVARINPPLTAPPAVVLISGALTIPILRVPYFPNAYITCTPGWNITVANAPLVAVVLAFDNLANGITNRFPVFLTLIGTANDPVNDGATLVVVCPIVNPAWTISTRDTRPSELCPAINPPPVVMLDDTGGAPGDKVENGVLAVVYEYHFVLLIRMLNVVSKANGFAAPRVQTGPAPIVY